VVAGELKVRGELGCGDVSQGFGADGPDSGDPGQVGATCPLMGEVEPEAWADGGFDAGAGLLGDERRIADEEAASACCNMAMGSAGVGRKSGSVAMNLRKRIWA